MQRKDHTDTFHGPIVLAVDLDGTLLHGSDNARLQIRSRVEAGQFEAVFATGRALVDVVPLLGIPSLPRPRYILADNGATLVHGETLEPVGDLHAQLERAWVDPPFVKKRLDRFRGLRFNSKNSTFRRHVYALSPDAPLEEILACARELNSSCTYTPGRWLEVLPPGVDKGSSLRWLLQSESLTHRRVVAAGDQLPDLPLLKAAHHPIVVANACPQFRALVRQGVQAYEANAEGADGVWEALECLELLWTSPMSR